MNVLNAMRDSYITKKPGHVRKPVSRAGLKTFLPAKNALKTATLAKIKKNA
jgi:hypothetical protein